MSETPENMDTPASSRKKKVVAGILVDYAGSFISIVIGFVVVPLFFRYITKEDYGVWLAVNGIIGIITLVEIGVDVYLTTIVANDNIFFSDEFTGYLASSLFVKTIIVGIFLLAGIITYFFLPSLISADALLIAQADTAYQLALVALVTGAYLSTISTIMTGRNHLALVNGMTVTAGIVTSILTVCFLHLRFGLASFPLASLLAAMMQQLALLVIMKRRYPHVVVRVRSLSKEKILSLYHYTRSFQLLRFVHILRTQYVVVLIGNLLGPAAVTLYNITNKIPQTIPTYVSRGASALFPSFAAYFAEGNLEKVRGIFLQTSRLVIRAALLAGIMMIYFNEPFISLWVGKDKFAGIWVAAILALNMVLTTVTSSIGTIIFAKGEFRRWPFWSIAEVVIAVVLSFLLHERYGLTGIVFGFFVGSLISSAYVCLMVSHILKVKISAYLAATAQYVFVPTAVSLVIALFVTHRYSMDTWLMLFIAVILVGAGNVLSLEGVRFLFSREKTLKKRFIHAINL